MAAVKELIAHLEALRASKAPGVTRSRVAALTSLCNDNAKVGTFLQRLQR